MLMAALSLGRRCCGGAGPQKPELGFLTSPPMASLLESDMQLGLHTMQRHGMSVALQTHGCIIVPV